MALARFEHELELAKELLDDIELSRLNAEALFLKAARLARLCGTEEFKKWVGFEIRGYVSDDNTSLKFMTKTGRWTKRDENKGYWAPIAQIEAVINSQTLKLNSLGTPNVSGVTMAYSIMKEHHEIINNVSNSISTYSGIKSRALGVLHDIVSAIYYEK